MSLASAILAISQLRGYWKLDDGSGTSVHDSGPGGHDGTVTGKRTAAGLANLPGQATQFGYSGNVGVSVPHHADFDVEAAFSVVQCVRLWGMESATDVLYYRQSGFASPKGSTSVVGTDVRPTLEVYGGNVVCTATSGISDIDRWHLVIRTWDGATAKIYLDGSDVSGSTTAPSPAFTHDNSALSLSGGSTGRETCAHIALYGKTLSAGEVATLTAAFNVDKVATPYPTLSVGIHQDLVYNGTPGVRQNAITRMRALHATYSRSSVLWDYVEPTQGNFDWTRHDDVMDELDARDMSMHACIVGSPTWANGGADRWQVPGTGADSSFNTWLSLYTSFVTTFATRYLGRIHRYELWNEPNLLGFWNNASSAVDPAQYRAWYNAIRAAILSVDATAEVCFAGLSSWSAVGGSDQTGEEFFRNCMAAGAMTIDHFAYHPYVSGDPNTYVTPFNNTFYGDIRQIRDVLLEYGYTTTPIWLTEFGFPSSGGANTETTQRDYLQHALEGIRDRVHDIANELVVFIDYDQGSYVEGLHTNMPGDGSPPTQKLAASMFSNFAQPFDLPDQFEIAVATWASVRNR